VTGRADRHGGQRWGVAGADWRRSVARLAAFMTGRRFTTDVALQHSHTTTHPRR